MIKKIVSRIFPATASALLLIIAVSQSAFASTQPYISSHQINIGTGNKYLTETDVKVLGPTGTLSFTRTYNSQSNEDSPMGYGWTADFSEKLVVETAEIRLTQSGGRVVVFSDNGSDAWINQTGKEWVITATTEGYKLKEANGTVKLFDASGRIVSEADRNNNAVTYTYVGNDLTIADGFGRSLAFDFDDASGKLDSIVSPLGTTSYAYDGNNNLVTVTGPDQKTIQYVYDDPNDVHNLTGVLDKNGTRILTIEYDAGDRAIRSVKQGDANELTIAYPAYNQRTVTDSLGEVTSYNLKIQYGIVMVESFTGPGCSSCGSPTDTTYTLNDRLQVATATDANGVTTSYSYDAKGNRASITKALGTDDEYTESYTYNSQVNKRETITEPSVASVGQSKITTMTYDANGNMLTRTESGFRGSSPVSRTITYTYDERGRVTSIDGPLAGDDIINLSYYPNEETAGLNRGFLYTVTDSLGHTTTYADYNGQGLAETITDANGLISTFHYNSQGLVSERVIGGLTTNYNYDSAGQLLSVTLPGNRTVSYSYNAAGQVETISDSLGNSIGYTYDGRGQKEGTVDP